MNFNRPIILASKSPRRQEILRQAGFAFNVTSNDVNETYPSDIPPERVAAFLSEKKANAYQEDLGNGILITADTVVKVDKTLLQKPRNKREAEQMLNTLSDRTHEVITGVTIKDKSQLITFSDSTQVTFDRLDSSEIDYYITKYAPFDKAGAYGIQEWIGMIGIKKITGSYFNVVGLPIQKLYQKLKIFHS